jgi:excisionase family DNA binding protein
MPKSRAHPIPPLHRLVPLDQAAADYGIHRRTIERWGADGKITLYKLGPKLLRVDVSELSAMIRPVPGTGPDAAA